MKYDDYVHDLVQCLVVGEQQGKLFHQNIREIAKGEVAVLLFLLHEKDGASAQEISQRFEINTSRVAAILNSLSHKDYIERVLDNDDKRKIHVYITKKGESFCMQKYAFVIEYSTNVMKLLGEEDTKEYVRITKRIAEIIRGMER